MTGDYITLLLVVIAIVFGVFYVGYYERRKAMVATLQMFQNHNCPVLVCSNFPGDTSVNDRAETWRTMLETSGNKWYMAGKLRIEVFPYNAYMKSGSLYGYTWAEYLLACSVRQHQLIIDFQGENPGLVPLLVTNYRTNTALN